VEEDGFGALGGLGGVEAMAGKGSLKHGGESPVEIERE
jgi:hypothetical protein